MTPRQALEIVLDATSPGYSDSPEIVEARAVLKRTIEQHEAAVELADAWGGDWSPRLVCDCAEELQDALTKGNP